MYNQDVLHQEVARAFLHSSNLRPDMGQHHNYNPDRQAHQGYARRSRHDAPDEFTNGKRIRTDVNRDQVPIHSEMKRYRVEGQGAVQRPPLAQSANREQLPVDPLEAQLTLLVKSCRPSSRQVQERVDVVTAAQAAFRGRAIVSVYGSLRTGLFLRSSDVDFCVQFSSFPTAASSAFAQSRRDRFAANSATLNAISHALRAYGGFSNFVAIRHAKVPLIKCVHRTTRIEMDFSSNDDGLRTSDYVRHWTGRLPLARPLILLLKILLSHARLNDPSSGGLGSFGLSLMIFWYLRVEAPSRLEHSSASSPTLALLLLDCLEFYSRAIDYSHVEFNIATLTATRKVVPSHELCMLNPLDTSKNATQACSVFRSSIQPAFSREAAALRNSSPGSILLALASRAAVPTEEQCSLSDRLREDCEALGIYC